MNFEYACLRIFYLDCANGMLMNCVDKIVYQMCGRLEKRQHKDLSEDGQV